MPSNPFDLDPRTRAVLDILKLHGLYFVDHLGEPVEMHNDPEQFKLLVVDLIAVLAP